LERFYVQSFGCRASQADGAEIASALEFRGLTPAATAAEAGLIILNSCTVTRSADEDLRHAVRRAHRENPSARILVTGCFAQRAPREIAALEGVTWVVGNDAKSRIPDIAAPHASAAPYHGQIHISGAFGPFELLAHDAGSGRTRPTLKIQDGCNNLCTFCIIPNVRGPSRSAPPDDIVARVRQLAGVHPEIVLSGINLGRWGRERGSTLRLVDLLRRLLDETPVRLLRLSSVEPMDFSDALLDLMASTPRIAPHVHAPLQSGSDTVLRRMRRRYRTRHYEQRIRRAHSLLPDAAIGADVMAGFPGETDAEFEQSLQFIESLPFTYLHVFPYSERPGTPASESPDQVPAQVKRERARRLRELGAAKNQAFRRRMVGRRLPVVTLHDGAITANYLPVQLAHPRPANLLVEIEIGGLTPEALAEKPVFPIVDPSASPLRMPDSA
jgi:threonylcarbamoyladenosine tRNA methylthiotransferase MtaB